MSRFDRWSTEGILPAGSPEWWAKQLEIARTMAPIVRNPRIPDSAGMVPKGETPPAAGSGSVELRSPPGIDIIDRMVEADTRRKQLAAIQEELTNREIEHRLAGDDDKVQSEYNPFDAKNMKK